MEKGKGIWGSIQPTQLGRMEEGQNEGVMVGEMLCEQDMGFLHGRGARVKVENKHRRDDEESKTYKI